MEDLELFTGKAAAWERTSGELVSDGVMQATVKEQSPGKLRSQIETTPFTRFSELRQV